MTLNKFIIIARTLNSEQRANQISFWLKHLLPLNVEVNTLPGHIAASNVFGLLKILQSSKVPVKYRSAADNFGLFPTAERGVFRRNIFNPVKQWCDCLVAQGLHDCPLHDWIPNLDCKT